MGSRIRVCVAMGGSLLESARPFLGFKGKSKRKTTVLGGSPKKRHSHVSFQGALPLHRSPGDFVVTRVHPHNFPHKRWAVQRQSSILT